MQHDFPYQPGYVGDLDSFSPQIAADLERLLWQLDPQLFHSVTRDTVPYLRGDNRFRHIIAIEELDGRPAVVGTANISFVRHSYDDSGNLTDLPALALGSFVVDENVRGKGVAGRIWDALLDAGRTRNVHLMQFTSRPARSAAHSFYAKMGAVQITPVTGVKFEAHGTEKDDTAVLPDFEEQQELAKGRVVFVLSEFGAPRMNETLARAFIARSGAGRFEQLIPVAPDSPEATTMLFSVSF